MTDEQVVETAVEATPVPPTPLESLYIAFKAKLAEAEALVKSAETESVTKAKEAEAWLISEIKSL